MRTLLLASALVGLAACATGCAIFRPSRVVVIDSSSDVVRLGRDVRGTVYMHEDGGWKKVGPITLPEGWYAGPLPKDK